MSPFHSGLNHWQRQWLSDRLHKKDQEQGAGGATPIVRSAAKASAPKKRKPAKKRAI